MFRQRFLTSTQVAAWTSGGLLIPSRAGGVGYAAEVIADNPVSYWRFEEASGPYEATYGASTATVVGSPTRAAPGAARSARAVGFPTVSSYVQLGAAGSLPGSAYRAAFTFECWFKVATFTAVDTGQVYYQLVGTDTSSDAFSDRSWSMGMGRYTSNLGHVAVLVAVGTTVAEVGWNVRLDDNVWHHGVGVYDGGTLKMYVDGVLRASAAKTGSVNAGSRVPVVGLNHYHSSPYPAVAFPGVVDEVAIYPTALSAARVLAHYQAA